MIGDITVGERARIGPRSHLEGNVKIGTGTNLVRDDEVIGDVSIGNYCAIARDTTVQGRDHVTKWPAMQMRFYKRELGTELPHTSKGPVEIGSDVWIGTGVTILSGVSIGHGAIIGAGAIVTKDVEPYSVVAGVPASRVGWRFPSHVRKQLLDIAWWNWDEEKIRRNVEFFTTDLSTVDSISDYLA
ncbi:MULTISPECIES: CatB-related O-acetyltransferase [Haloferax]|uniref:Antibiotic acetyltransferase n=2 Tax=Haloferax TaxID=2251 RepID=A0A6G1Z3L0_9EURY|nr:MULTISPECIES: CatB-related O-acetyltransferase [Haloferax]KAB1188443.1 CatB-related O-acetyltransferase [Haloferax sp. CBA1149]MRW81136.1 antibiotic acetyltransferase [Haloferax marinisediminis]